MEVASQISDQSDLRKARIKVDMLNVGVIAMIMEVESERGCFRHGVRCYRVANVLASAIVVNVEDSNSIVEIFEASPETNTLSGSR